MTAVRLLIARAPKRAPFRSRVGVRLFFVVLAFHILLGQSGGPSVPAVELAYAATPPPWELSRFTVEGRIRTEAGWVWGDGDLAAVADALGGDLGFTLEPKLLLDATGSLPGSTEMRVRYDEDEPVEERLDLTVLAPEYTVRAGLHFADLRLAPSGAVAYVPVPPLADDVFLPRARRWSGISGNGRFGPWRTAAFAGSSEERPAVAELIGTGGPGPYHVVGVGEEARVPIARGTVRVEVGGRVAVPGADYFLDYTTGELYFTYPVPAGTAIRVDFEYEASEPQIGLGLRTRYDGDRWHAAGARYVLRSAPEAAPVAVWQASGSFQPFGGEPRWRVGVEGAALDPAGPGADRPDNRSGVGEPSDPAALRLVTSWRGPALSAVLEWMKAGNGFPSVYAPIASGSEQARAVLDWRPSRLVGAWVDVRQVWGEVDGEASGSAESAAYRAGLSLNGAPASLDAATLELETRGDGDRARLLTAASAERNGWEAAVRALVPLEHRPPSRGTAAAAGQMGRAESAPAGESTVPEGASAPASFSLSVARVGSSGLRVSGSVGRGVLWGRRSVREAPSRLEGATDRRWRLSTHIDGPLLGGWAGNARAWAVTEPPDRGAAPAGGRRLADVWERSERYWDVRFTRQPRPAPDGARLEVRWAGGLPTPWAPLGERRLSVVRRSANGDRLWAEFEEGRYRSLDDDELREDWGGDGWEIGAVGDDAGGESPVGEGASSGKLVPLRSVRLGVDLIRDGWSYRPSVGLEYRGQSVDVGDEEAPIVSEAPHVTVDQELTIGIVGLSYGMTLPPASADGGAPRPGRRVKLTVDADSEGDESPVGAQAMVAWSDEPDSPHGWGGTERGGRVEVRLGGAGPLALTTAYEFERRHRSASEVESGASSWARDEAGKDVPTAAERLDRATVALAWRPSENRTLELSYNFAAGSRERADGSVATRFGGARWRAAVIFDF